VAELAKNMFIGKGFRDAIIVTEKATDSTMDGLLLSKKPVSPDPVLGGKQLSPKTGTSGK
jgi:hypothetical protein